MSRINALESFFRLIRERVHIPISTDLYGFNTYYRMGNWIGQNIEMLADYVDVICPMYYPSHFPRTFMKELPYLERAEKNLFRGYSTGFRNSGRTEPYKTLCPGIPAAFRILHGRTGIPGISDEAASRLPRCRFIRMDFMEYVEQVLHGSRTASG